MSTEEQNLSSINHHRTMTRTNRLQLRATRNTMIPRQLSKVSPIKERTKQVTTELKEEDGECEIQKFLEPFPRERLIEFLKEAANNDSDFRDRMKRVADHSLLHRQISVSSKEAFTAETLVNYFKNFGEILEYKTCYFHDLRLYYGFILFKNRIAACKALKVPMKHIGGIYIYCKFPRKDNFPERGKRRISVSKIEEEIDVEKFTELFSEFGEIEEGPLEFDKKRKKIKGHCSVVYNRRKTSMESIKNPNKMLQGQSLYCYLDSYWDVPGGEPEPRYLRDPSVPLSSSVPLDATDDNAGPGRAHGDAGEDQNPVATSRRYQGLTNPLNSDAENPPNPSFRSMSTEKQNPVTKIWDTINREADCTSSHRQIYVCSDAPFSAETLVDYFNKFGQVLDCKTTHDRDSRLCYGFFPFKNRTGASKALKDDRTKCIGEIDVHCGFIEEDHFPELEKRRVYVGTVKEKINVDKLAQFFSESGEIEEGPLGVDKITGKIKGNCCFVYKTRESAKEVIKVPEKIFEDHILHCRLDSCSDVSDGDPEPEYLLDPSLPSSSTVPQGATDHNANPGTNTLPGRAQDDVGADQSPIPTSPFHHGSSAPSIPEPSNPPNPSNGDGMVRVYQEGAGQTDTPSNPQGDLYYNAWLDVALPFAGAHQNLFFAYPHHQGSPASLAPGYQYDRGSDNVHPTFPQHDVDEEEPEEQEFEEEHEDQEGNSDDEIDSSESEDGDPNDPGDPHDPDNPDHQDDHVIGTLFVSAEAMYFLPELGQIRTLIADFISERVITYLARHDLDGDVLVAEADDHVRALIDRDFHTGEISYIVAEEHIELHPPQHE